MEAQSPTVQTRPRPEDFTDYRAFLHAMIKHLKATHPHFSYRYFSRLAGFSSPNFLKLVAEGQRRLSNASIPKFARGLGLDEREQEAFELLVYLGQAQTDAERNRWYRRLQNTRNHQPQGRIEADQYALYSDWHNVIIRELVGLKGFREEPRWIARMLKPAISTTKARQALALLSRLKLTSRNAKEQLQQHQSSLTTGGRVTSLAIRNFHRSMLDLAARSLDQVATPDRNITGLTLPLTQSQYTEICDRIACFRKEILEFAEAQPTDLPTAVHHLQFALFPVTKEVK